MYEALGSNTSTERKQARKKRKERESIDKDAEKLGSVHCQLERKMVQPLWKTVQLSYKS